jgi:hypothetical protein
MEILMVKKRLLDGSECRKCLEVTELLQSKGLWQRIDQVLWADEADPQSSGMELSRKLGVDRAPFFLVRDEKGETVYTSVLQLIRERLAAPLTSAEKARAIDPDEVGGI